MYEYKVVPAPQLRSRGLRFWGRRANEADTITAALNATAEEGWEFQRTEVLSVRGGASGRRPAKQKQILIFRRAVARLDSDVPTPDRARFRSNGAAPRAMLAKDRELMKFVRSGGRRIKQEDHKAASPIEAVGGSVHRPANWTHGAS